MTLQNEPFFFDCCDNFESRQLVNRFCVQHALPLISAAAANFSGQLFAYYPYKSGCYHCLYPKQTQINDSCRDVGILGPMVGAIASMQALIGLKVMLGDELVYGKLWLFNGQSFEWRTVFLEPDPSCVVCSTLREKHPEVDSLGAKLFKEKVA